MSIDLEAQVLAVAEAMWERDADVLSAYGSAYRAENREHLSDSRKIYQAKNSHAIAGYQRAYQAKNSHAIAGYQRAYQAKNSHAIADRQRAYQAKNSHAIADRQRAYRAANKELIAAKRREYRARKNSNRAPVGPSKGESHPGAKLNDDLVRIIRSRSGAGESLHKIADEIGVSNSSISDVIHRRTWAHVI